MEKLKFLIDLGVGKKTENWLKSNGFDIRSVRDIDIRAKDSEILRIAVMENRMVITMDKDFGELVYNMEMNHTGVLILRLEDSTGDEKVYIIKKILVEYGDKIRNRFCVFQEGRLRIRE